MRTAMKDCLTCVALMLALVAAVMSTNGQAGIPHKGSALSIPSFLFHDSNGLKYAAERPKIRLIQA